MKVTKTYELERITHNGSAIHHYELELEANYGRGYPGNYENPPEPAELEIISCKCGGEFFELTDTEYEQIVDSWLIEPDLYDEPDYERDDND